MGTEPERSIEVLRSEVKFLTEEIVELVGKRVVLTKKIGEYKRETGLDVINRSQERSLQDLIKAKCKASNINESLGLRILNFLFRESIAIQNEMINKPETDNYSYPNQENIPCLHI